MARQLIAACCIVLGAATALAAAPQPDAAPAVGASDQSNPAQTAVRVAGLARRAAALISRQQLAEAGKLLDQIAADREPYREWVRAPRAAITTLLGPDRPHPPSQYLRWGELAAV